MPALRRGGRGDQVPRVERMMPTRGLKGASRVTPSESAGGEKNRYLPGKQYRILRKGKAVVRA